YPRRRHPCLGVRARRIRRRPALGALPRIDRQCRREGGSPRRLRPRPPGSTLPFGRLTGRWLSPQAMVRSMGFEQRDDPYASARIAGEALQERMGGQPYDVALVMGSGWVPAADILGTADHEIKTTELPGFPPPAVAGHAGAIRSIPVAGHRALVFLGRTHL